MTSEEIHDMLLDDGWKPVKGSECLYEREHKGRMKIAYVYPIDEDDFDFEIGPKLKLI